VISLFVLAAGFLAYLHLRVAPMLPTLHPDGEYRRAVVGAASIMLGILLTNALAFSKLNLIDWEFSGQVSGTRWELLTSHASVLLGTASLMWLVTLATREPVVWAEQTPMRAATRTWVVIAEKLLPRFWWAALGLGALFGVVVGVGPILHLAVGLTFFWVVGRISLALQHRGLLR